MYVKQVKRKCGIRGCKSTDCFAVSRSREVGNTVIVCKECLSLALGAITDIDPKTKSNIRMGENRAVPGLFFNAEALGKTPEEHMGEFENDCSEIEKTPNESVETEESETETEESPNGEDTAEDIHGELAVICRECGKTFDSVRGLQTHARYCKSQLKE